MLKRAFAAAGVVLVIVLATAGLDQQSVVDGHIMRCSGLYRPNDYGGGTVTVVQGTDIMWSRYVASQSVPDGGGFQFFLQPGDYILLTDMSEIGVHVRAGEHVSADIPNRCI